MQRITLTEGPYKGKYVDIHGDENMLLSKYTMTKGYECKYNA